MNHAYEENPPLCLVTEEDKRKAAIQFFGILNTAIELNDVINLGREHGRLNVVCTTFVQHV